MSKSIIILLVLAIFGGLVFCYYSFRRSVVNEAPAKVTGIPEWPTGTYSKQELMSYDISPAFTDESVSVEFKDIKTKMTTDGVHDSYAKVDLDHDGVPEVIGIPDEGGSHGYDFEVFQKKSNDWVSIFKPIVSTQGVYVLPSQTQGFSDIATAYYPASVNNGYDVYGIWKWNGKTYIDSGSFSFKK